MWIATECLIVSAFLCSVPESASSSLVGGGHRAQYTNCQWGCAAMIKSIHRGCRGFLNMLLFRESHPRMADLFGTVPATPYNPRCLPEKDQSHSSVWGGEDRSPSGISRGPVGRSFHITTILLLEPLLKFSPFFSLTLVFLPIHAATAPEGISILPSIGSLGALSVAECRTISLLSAHPVRMSGRPFLDLLFVMHRSLASYTDD